jgi:hypothetical protein
MYSAYITPASTVLKLASTLLVNAAASRAGL